MTTDPEQSCPQGRTQLSAYPDFRVSAGIDLRILWPAVIWQHPLAIPLTWMYRGSGVGHVREGFSGKFPAVGTNFACPTLDDREWG